MNYEQRIAQMADRYRAQGYMVVIQPGPDDLPGFARDFKVEIVARRDDGSALVSVKRTPSDLESDPDIQRYVEITAKQAGWRFDVFVVGPENPAMSGQRDVAEPTEEEITHQLDDVQKLLHARFAPQSLVAAWAVLEAAMRIRLRAEGEEAGWGTSPRTLLNGLVSTGAISMVDLHRLEGLLQLRNAIAHGFSPQVSVDDNAVEFLIDMTRRLVKESAALKQPA